MTDKEIYPWLLDAGEPWTRYRTYVELLERPEGNSAVQEARAATLAHPQIQALIAAVEDWPGYALKRHSDARHPLHKLGALADFGLRVTDPGMAEAIDTILIHQSEDGAVQSLVNLPRAFGGTGEDAWSWILCDAAPLLGALLALGCGDDPRVARAAEHLVALVSENGWRCHAASSRGTFKGPGRREDPCPIVNVYALRALSHVPALQDSGAVHAAAETLLHHWKVREERKFYMFGIGTDFRKLKYPLVWYNLLNVLDALSRYPFVHADPRFQEMLSELTTQADDDGRYTATSMYRAWKDWSFADKKQPSPWLTFIALRIQKRVATST